MAQRELTPAQRLAITSTDHSTAIIAGAGSGKTHVLVERIVHLLTHDAHTLDQLLCITFTEKAAAELKARLLDRLPAEQHPAVTQAQISTFHAFQARILREQATVVGIDLQATIMEESRAGLLLAQTCREILLASLSDGDADTARLIDHYQFAKVAEWIETFVADRWHFLRTEQDDDASLPAMTPEETQISATIRRLVERVIAAYTAAKHRAAQIDFADLEIVSLDLLCRHDTVRSAYQQRFRAILVDEAQDVNDAQAELLRQLFVPGKNTLTIVGDPKQSIYRFRGANVEAFGSLAQLITEHGGHRIALQENFRSREGVCAFVNQVAATMPDYENLVATRPAADAPATVALDIATQAKATAETRRDQEAAQIAADLVARHAAGAAFRQHVLLFQSKSDMDRYAAALRAAAIPVVQHSGGTFLDRPEVIDLLAALETIANHATGRSNPTALLRLLRSPLIGLTDDECYRLVFPDLTTIDKPRPLMDAARAHSVIGPLLHQWTEAAQHVSFPALLERIIRTTDYETHCLATDPSGQSAANIEKLYWLATSAQMHLADFLAHMNDLRRSNARMPDQPIVPDGHNVVQLMTVHAAKGLEFDVVYLADLFRQVRPDAEAWLFLPGHGLGCKTRDADDPFADTEETPRWRALADREKEAHAAEHQRLLYVALTRARECLVLPMHEEMTRDKDTWHAVLKPFAKEIGR